MFFSGYAFMETLYYNMGETIIAINYPIDESGRYCIESEDDQELGHLYLDYIDKSNGQPTWKGTTEEINKIAAEFGDFIEQSEL